MKLQDLGNYRNCKLTLIDYEDGTGEIQANIEDPFSAYHLEDPSKAILNAHINPAVWTMDLKTLEHSDQFAKVKLERVR